ncbi:hypothetical protein F2P44_27110 [Massilia sp. CCM 8695]|uniref:DUF4148 domain-containing protein n=1 Tax=Massilia frigida TaxID=2609281 RepID=A0ABX0NCR7_9BURK|nr:hypothetical protein [Massilia frigida]NHZ82917.1 hypothetical protein [Massilia frigida]
MNASKLFTAVAALVLTGSAFAADAPAASTAVSAAASSLSVPAVTINQSRSRSDVSAEAVEFVKNYKTAFAVQLEQYKN